MLKGMLRPIFCIDIKHVITGNEKLFKIYLKKLFFQNVLSFYGSFL